MMQCIARVCQRQLILAFYWYECPTIKLWVLHSLQGQFFDSACWGHMLHWSGWNLAGISGLQVCSPVSYFTLIGPWYQFRSQKIVKCSSFYDISVSYGHILYMTFAKFLVFWIDIPRLLRILWLLLNRCESNWLWLERFCHIFMVPSMEATNIIWKGC